MFPPQAEKISRMSMISLQPDGAQVEFVGWINTVEGDEDLGIELYMSNDVNASPQAIVTLKDGQTAPVKETERCLRGRVVKREEIAGSTTFWINNAELIDCY
jgi:hypothetical protein